MAFESFGVRSMATYIETDQGILIDPGTSLAPKRFGFPPWKTEYEALYQTRKNIEEYAQKAGIICISHYHHDHFTPFQINRYLDSSPKSAEKIYKNKTIFLKDPTSSINKNQQKRAQQLLGNLVGHDCEIRYSDNREYKMGGTNIKFSPPLPHGTPSNRMGFVIALTLEWEDKKVLHASDIQGPIYDDSKNYILEEKPDTLILSGPPLYLLEYKLRGEDLESARINLLELSEKIPLIIVDHHLLRDFGGIHFIQSLNKHSTGRIINAAELIGVKPKLLEAERKKFYLLD